MDMLIELKQISEDMKKSGALPANVQSKIKKIKIKPVSFSNQNQLPTRRLIRDN